MIISRTPFRLSFFGGGTDYPGWYRKHGGAVLATTMDKYCYITCRYRPPFFEHKYCLIYSKMEYCQTIDEIIHPSAREVIRHLGVTRGLEIHHDGDLPARSGIGSSSAFCVGLLHALHALQGRMASKRQLALESIHIEQEVLSETVGSQDQVTAAYGGFNHIAFHENGELTVRPVTVAEERLRELDRHMLLFFTGIKRTSSDVAQSYVENIDRNRRHLRIMKDLVDEALSVLKSEQGLEAFGELLHEGWLAKRSLSDRVSSSEVDEIYQTALAAGAVGGKLIGAGGGGFLLLFASPERHELLKLKLERLIHVPFHFEFSGSQIIFYDPETEYFDQERARAAGPQLVFRERPGSGS